MHDAVKDGKRVLVEGANALMLDLDFGMSYPILLLGKRMYGLNCFIKKAHIRM